MYLFLLLKYDEYVFPQIIIYSFLLNILKIVLNVDLQRCQWGWGGGVVIKKKKFLVDTSIDMCCIVLNM